jgi:hypothetical protein
MAATSSPTGMVKPAVSTPSPSMESAVSRKTERGTTEVFSSIQLRSPSGAFWKLRVDDAGALYTTKLTR